MPNEPIRVGLVGTGFGRRVTAQAFARDERFDLMGVWGRTPKNVEEAAQELGIPALPTFEAMLEQKPQALILSVPGPVQADLLARVPEGVHLFCEKPLGGGTATALANAKRCSENRVAMMDFEFLRLDVFRQAQEWLPRIGRVDLVNIRWCLESYARRYGLTDSWKMRVDEGGGITNLLVSHTLSYLRFFFGELRQLRGESFNGDQTLRACFEMERAPIVTGVFSQETFESSGHVIEIYGKEGRILLQNPNLKDYIKGFELDIKLTDGTHHRLETELNSRQEDGRIGAVEALVREFGDCIVEKRPVASDLDLHCGAWVEACLDGLKQDGWWSGV